MILHFKKVMLSATLYLTKIRLMNITKNFFFSLLKTQMGGGSNHFLDLYHNKTIGIAL